MGCCRGEDSLLAPSTRKLLHHRGVDILLSWSDGTSIQSHCPEIWRGWVTKGGSRLLDNKRVVRPIVSLVELRLDSQKTPAKREVWHLAD